MKAQTNVTMPIEEYNKLLKFREAAMEKKFVVIVSVYGNDVIKLKTESELIKKLKEIIEKRNADMLALTDENGTLKLRLNGGIYIPEEIKESKKWWQKLFE